MLEDVVDELVVTEDHFVFISGACSKKPVVTFGY